MDGITWEKYLDDIKVIFEISQRLNDNWVLTKKVNQKYFSLDFHVIFILISNYSE